MLFIEAWNNLIIKKYGRKSKRINNLGINVKTLAVVREHPISASNWPLQANLDYDFNILHGQPQIFHIR